MGSKIATVGAMTHGMVKRVAIMRLLVSRGSTVAEAGRRLGLSGAVAADTAKRYGIKASDETNKAARSAAGKLGAARKWARSQ